MAEDEAGAKAHEGPPPRSDDSIRASVERLIASGKDLAEAELDWARLKGRSLAALLKRGLLFAVIAASALMVALSLLLVAGIIALAPYLGLLYATLVMIALAFLIAIVAGLVSRNAFHTLMGGDEK